MEKLTLEQFGEIMKEALASIHYYPQLRLGQEIFNTTYKYHPELANSLRMTGADCFHQDSKIIHFVNAILK